MNKISFLCLFVIVASACFGCGKSNQFPVARATGVVTCNGSPVPNITVDFHPVLTKESKVTGRRGSAFTDENGKFVLTTYQANDGAVIGKHEVYVRANGATDSNCPAELSARKVVQTVEVIKGKNNTFTIDLPVRDKRTPLETPDAG